jgi:DegV family protein with EDD domain
MARVAIVTDSAADLPPEVAARLGVHVVPLFVRFGSEEFRAGVNLAPEEFWTRMTAPDAPFPTTAAASPGTFAETYRRCFDQGADSVVCVSVGSKLSATIKSALLGVQEVPAREIHVVDSTQASMGVGLLVVMAAEMAVAGASGAEIAAEIRARVSDVSLFVALDTLEYLRKGGRISATQAAIGTVLSIKPIITITDGAVETVDKIRTRAKARDHVLDLLTETSLERFTLLHTGPSSDVEGFRARIAPRLPGSPDPAAVPATIIGPSVGPHVGPGCIGGVGLRPRS